MVEAAKASKGRSTAGTASDILEVVRILPDVLFRCYKGKDGRIYWSLNEGGLAEQFHLTTAEIQGKTLEDLFPGGASDELREHFEEAFRGESTIFTNQIGDRHFRHFPKPILDEEGNVTEVVGYIADVTDLVRTQAELERANRELDAFVHAASHDLRNPLTALHTLVQVMREQCGDSLDDKAMQYLAKMDDTVASMQSITSALLQLSRARNAELVRVPVDLTALARDVAKTLEMEDPKREVTWEIEPDLHAQADRDLLRIVLQNLLGNAWKYTAPHPATISFTREDSDCGPAFVVRDHGPGFEPSLARMLFEPFKRAHGEEFQGSGVGLSTVERVIRRHGGTVWAESSKDDGTSFWFTLP